MIAWNAAVHAAQGVLNEAKDHFLNEHKYELAALARDLREAIPVVTRKRE